ncbi:MAG TPA: F0F1 ATP synthase subunit alpha [Nitrospirae bacterium]|nr:F0F1 ATP synthase subunit alpha [Nitrospirota bacterium]
MDETLNVTGLLEAIGERVRSVRFDVRVAQEGVVVDVGDGVARVEGLPDAGYYELLDFEGGVQGIVFGMDRRFIDVVILGDCSLVKAGGKVGLTGRVASLPVGEGLLGRVIDPLGTPLDDLGDIEERLHYPVEREALSIIERDFVREPLYTGIKMIDSMLPIGRGQRELIIGDSGTGKTSIALDAIVNQKGGDVVCVYVAIGQKKAQIARVIEDLQRHGALDFTAVVAADADASPAMKFLAPYSGCAVAEFFMDSGTDTLVVYDDLTKHANAYRGLSLLLRRTPGREAFPGDVFYIHSRLLERAARRHDSIGGGSITALPIVEAYAGRISGYISTNLISITDGQIVLDRGLFNRGILPPIDIRRSVSRIGGKTQVPAMRKVAEKLKLDYAQFLEVEIFTRFGARVEERTAALIRRGQRLREVLKQPRYSPLSLFDQVMTFFILNEGYLDSVDVEKVHGLVTEILKEVDREGGSVIEEIRSSGDLTESHQAALRSLVGKAMERVH